MEAFGCDADFDTGLAIERVGWAEFIRLDGPVKFLESTKIMSFCLIIVDISW